jgi:hypothetical protein
MAFFETLLVKTIGSMVDLVALIGRIEEWAAIQSKMKTQLRKSSNQKLFKR